MTEIVLTQKQMRQLKTITEKFPDIAFFYIVESNENGIGPVIQVKFDLFGNDKNTIVDVTDVENW